MRRNWSIDPLHRRDFLRYTSGAMAGGSLVSLLSSCSAAEDLVGLDEPSRGLVAAAAAVRRYRVSVSGPKSLLVPGAKVTVTGMLRDGLGRAVANKVIGVTDGIGRLSAQTKTNSSGAISYATKVSLAGPAVLEFIVDGERHPFVFQAAQAKGKVRWAPSFVLGGLALKNNSTRTITARITDSNGTPYVTSIARGAKRTLLSVKNTVATRVTTYGGTEIAYGPSSATATVDSTGVATATFTAGEALIRGSVYATSQADIGGCWAPGAGIGVAIVEVSGEIAFCLGTDGLNVGAGGSFGGAAAGVTLKVI